MKRISTSAVALLLAALPLAGAEPAAPAEDGRVVPVPAVSFVMAQVGPGAAVMISNLNVPAGAGRRQMLLRAAGPALASLGVERPLSDPAIALSRLDGAEIKANDNWTAEEMAGVDGAILAGVLPFAPESKDAAVLVTLEPGQYLLRVTSAGGDTGTAMVEVYDVTPRVNAQPPAAPALTLNAANRAPAVGQLLAHLPLKSGFTDATGRLVPLRVQGVTFREGAAWFDGKASELVLPQQPLARSAFSVAMWVKVENDAPGVGLVEQRSANQRNQHFHLVLRDKAPYLGFYLNDLRTHTPVTRARGWTHLVFQYNGRQQQVWVNGERVGVRRAGAYTGREGQFAIGRAPRWSNVPAQDFKGGLQDLRIYGRALSPSEIAALAAARP